MGNSVTGSYYTTPQRSMAAFDKLPKSPREALADAVENWAPQTILTAHNRQKRGFETGTEIAATIARWNREELAKCKDQRRRAIGPYKGNVPDPEYQKPKIGRSRRC
jgi:Family of unknown function (DUF6525)